MDIKACLGRWSAASALILLLAAPALAGDDAPGRERVWGFGWDQGLTVRRWLGAWELSLAAGPNDYLDKSEQRVFDPDAPDDLQGALEVPADDRREEGWVRLQAGYRVARYQSLAAVAFTGLVYNWEDSQYSHIHLGQDGLYDAYDTGRFTHRWALELGMRPAWRPVPFLSIETAFGLRFSWQTWSETEHQVYDSGLTSVRTERNGDFSSFQDFGWDGLGSLQIVVWF